MDGGRRGRSRTPAATSGLIYAHTRHATSRAGDPCPHDHVLLANVVEMLDRRGGYKAPDTSLWREHLRAATVVGRMASARKAVELGYAIEADHGPSGRLGHWAIAGIPKDALEVHSKRSAEIDAEMAEHGYSSYRARNIAARETRKAKRHTPVADLLPGFPLVGAGPGGRAENRPVDAVGEEAHERLGITFRQRVERDLHPLLALVRGHRSLLSFPVGKDSAPVVGVPSRDDNDKLLARQPATTPGLDATFRIEIAETEPFFVRVVGGAYE